MGNAGTILETYFVWGVLATSVILIALLLFSLRKKADERRRMIVSKAAVNTFYAIIIILILNLFGISIVLIGQGGITNPLSLLNTIAIIYFVELAYFKKAYGD